MTKRYDEEIAKSAFTAFLTTQLGLRNIIWEDVPQEYEPPDYYVSIEGIRYAVEVTGIFDQIDVSSGAYPSIAISASLQTFVEELESLAKSKDILTGGYAVTLSPLSDFPQRRERLLVQMIDYIKRTQCMANAEEEVVIASGFEYVGIKKIEDQENYIGEFISFTPKWKGDSIQELHSAFCHTLQVKESKLYDIHDPIILLILDFFYYLNGRDWQDMIQQIAAPSKFHTICRVSSPDKALILTSDDQQWVSS